MRKFLFLVLFSWTLTSVATGQQGHGGGAIEGLSSVGSILEITTPIQTTEIANDASDGNGATLILSGFRSSGSAPIGTLQFINTDMLTAYKAGSIRAANVGATDDGELQFFISSNATETQSMTIDKDGNIGFGTTLPTDILHIDEADGTDGTGFRLANGSASTTDASATNIFTIPTVTDQNYYVVGKFEGIQDDGSNSVAALHHFAFKNVSGTVTEQGDAEIAGIDDGGAVTPVSGVVSGTNYLIQVTGIVSENWEWEVGLEITVGAH